MLNSQNKLRLKDEEKPPLLEVKHLSLSFSQYTNGLQDSTIEVISDFELTVREGEIVAVVGASGSGKTLLADAILGILPESAKQEGVIRFEGEVLTREKQKKLRGNKIALIPQSIKALDPLMKTGRQVQASIRNSKDKKATQRRAFQKLGLAADAGKQFPFELSGGMARRVLISTAMVSDARLIIADEPTPGLDAPTRKVTIRHIEQLTNDGKSLMFITHDISAALQIADRVAGFYAGETVEIANIEDFSGTGDNLRHPYTRALWNALPENGFTPLKGAQPSPDESCSGCVFEPRCPISTQRCKQEKPQSSSVRNGTVRCFYA